MKSKYFFIFLSLVCVPTFALHAEANLFIFLSQPQLVAPKEVSKEIIIQTQSSKGVASSTEETLDLVFTSTSPTGHFVGISGKPVSKVMSRNTSNRTFYYTDTTEGNFILTVSGTGRVSHRSFSVSQHIIVGKISSSSPLVENIRAYYPPKEVVKEVIVKTNSLATTSEETQAGQVFKAPTAKGFVSRIFSWPILLFNFIRHLFVEE